MKKRMVLAEFLFLFIMCSFLSLSSGEQETRIKREWLLEDVRQLEGIIESSHPDPYTHGGGRIKFHYRLYKMLNAIPENGMTKNEFIKLLRPFLAAIGDQHTSIYTEYSINGTAPGGLPFVFGVVEQDLYVQIAFLQKDQEYYGSILASVEGVPVPELVRRFKNLEGCENDYFALRQFSRFNLLFEPYLHELIPEWTDRSKITFELRRPSGEIEKVVRDLPIEINPPLHFVESVIDLPKTDKSGFLYDFIDPLDEGRQIAYLRVDHMREFREAKERAIAGGTKEIDPVNLVKYKSATETFRSLVMAMKKKGTRTLIIDMRKNGGGNYMMAPILVYFLYGKDVLSSISKADAKSGGGHGVRYSPLFLKTHTNVTMEKINEGRSVLLREGDIDFARILFDTENDKDENPERLKIYATVPTFYREYRKGEYSGFYCPQNVIVLMTPWTSSSGLDMALFLYRAGATLVGTPSAQSPNSWGDLLEWQLNHSGIKGEVSAAFDIAFGDDPEMGRALPVHYPLTYEKLKSYNFDINSEFLYAMELLLKSKNK